MKQQTNESHVFTNVSSQTVPEIVLQKGDKK